MLNTKLVLVTGASGWLGTRLVHSLIHGLEDHSDFQKPDRKSKIRCFLKKKDRLNIPHAPDNLSIVFGDVRDPESLNAFFKDAEGAILFHTIGIIHPRHTNEFEEVNVGGTKNVLTAAIDAKVHRAVIVSSNSPIGCNPHLDHLFDESSPYNPYLGYGRSKMMMELFVNEISKQGKLEAVIIRPPWFYGIDQPPRQTLFFSMVRDGKVPLIGGGRNNRSMAYVDNICQGMFLAASNRNAVGQTYWIADERPYHMYEVIDTIQRLLEEEFGQTCSHKRIRLPGIVSDLAYWTDFLLQSVGIYHQKIHVLSEFNKTIACSIDKAKNELGYKPKIDLEEGMRRSIQWCIEKGYL